MFILQDAIFTISPVDFLQTNSFCHDLHTCEDTRTRAENKYAPRRADHIKQL